jgi:hypothetical protein
MEVPFQLRSPFLVLRVDLENRRTSKENEVLPENLEVDVQSRDWTYGPKYHNRHMTLSPDVRSRV